MTWVIKNNSESWTSEYFREVMLQQTVFPFLKNSQCVYNPEQPTFLHDKAPCFKALATQNLMRENNADSFGNNKSL